MPFHPGLGSGADLGQGSVVWAHPEAAATRSVDPSSRLPGVGRPFYQVSAGLPSVFSWPVSPPPGGRSKRSWSVRAALLTAASRGHHLRAGQGS